MDKGPASRPGRAGREQQPEGNPWPGGEYPAVDQPTQQIRVPPRQIPPTPPSRGSLQPIIPTPLPPLPQPTPRPVRPWRQEQEAQQTPQPWPREDATMLIPRDRGVPPGSRWPMADPDVLRPYDELATRMLPRVLEPLRTSEPFGETPPPITGIEPKTEGKNTSLVKASGRIAIASLISRITGFLWKVMLAWAIGIGIVNDSFNVANTLPNIIFELLLGGVLSSVVVPLLVRSQDDKDGGEAYVQRLMTMALVLLVIGTAAAVFAAPLFTSLYVDDSTTQASSELATAFAYLLLPQIFFYGMFALLSAILNAKHVFAPAAWAPVVNNLVVICTIIAVTIVPGDITGESALENPKLLVLGLGVTSGIVAQAIMLVPPVLRSGFKWKWRWGIDARMKEFGGLAGWILGYVAVSQVGFIVNTRVLTSGSDGGVTTYSYTWLLFQLPYGVIGVSLLTAIMPRLSRAAADGNHGKLVSDLSYASRLSTVTLVPISAVMTIVGSSIGLALFTVGRGTEASAGRLGDALAISAFALLPYALVMLQLRVFYAMKDARTPTLIMIVMTAVKIPLLYLCQALLDPEQIVLGAMMVNSLTYVVGAVLGQVWLWVTLGNLRSRRVIGVILFTVVASALGALAAALVGELVPDFFGTSLQAWVRLFLQSIVGIAVSFGVLIALKVDEIAPLTRRITRLIKRG